MYKLSDKQMDDLFNIMARYIDNASDDELLEHYKWYNVEVGDVNDLLYTMWESYCNSYDDAELVSRIKDLED